MPLISCLNTILTDFRPLFNRQNFTLFCTFILGLITHRHQATLTEIYQAVRPKSGYGSLVKFRSRGKWAADAVAKRLIQLLQGRFDNWVYVYNETQAIKTGTKQFGLHFFRNHRYQKRKLRDGYFLRLTIKITNRTICNKHLITPHEKYTNCTNFSKKPREQRSLFLTTASMNRWFSRPDGSGSSERDFTACPACPDLSGIYRGITCHALIISS